MHKTYLSAEPKGFCNFHFIGRETSSLLFELHVAIDRTLLLFKAKTSTKEGNAFLWRQFENKSGFEWRAVVGYKANAVHSGGDGGNVNSVLTL